MSETGTVLLLNYIKDGVDGINERLDAQNGRLRKAEAAIAVLQWAVGLVGVVALALFASMLR